MADEKLNKKPLKVKKVKKNKAVKQTKTQTPSNLRRANPSSRLAESASAAEIRENREGNSRLMARQQAQQPARLQERLPDGSLEGKEQNTLVNTIQQQMLTAPPTVAGNPAPQLNAAGPIRDQILATMALQPMYHNPQQPGGVGAYTAYPEVDPNLQRQHDLATYQADAHNESLKLGIAPPSQLREALMALVNYNGPVEGPAVTPIQQQAVNYARGEQSLHAGQYGLNMKKKADTENQRHTP